MWSPRRSRKFLIIFLASWLLAACQHWEPVAAVQTTEGTISLQRVGRTGGFVLTASPHTVLPLSGYTSARLEGTWDTTSGRLVVISGTSTDCSLRYTLAVIAAATVSVVPIGECGETYSFVQNNEMFLIRQSNTRNVKFWTFTKGSLRGPMMQRVRALRPARHAEQPHRTEGSADPILPPPISAPVGDEVVPPPVAGAS